MVSTKESGVVMVTKMNKISNTNFSAITDERGDLLIDRENHHLTQTGIRVQAPIRTPHQNGRRRDPMPFRGIRTPLAIILMVVITALIYQIISRTGSLEEGTSPAQQGKVVELPPSPKVEEQTPGKEGETKDKPEESL